jgi:uncharacterized membrane protein
VKLLIRVLSILLAVAIVVLAYYITIYVLGLLGIVLPANIVTVIFVIVGLVAAIGALRGDFDPWFRWGPPKV